MLLTKVEEQYFKLLTSLEAEICRVQEFHQDVIHCRRHCCACCQEISLLPLEAAIIQAFLKSLPEHTRANIQPPTEQDVCPFLSDRLCTIYQARPIICRTHGLPIAYVDPEREVVEVSTCPVNLDPYNETLLSLNDEYLGHREKSQARRIPMGHLLNREAIGR
jgi:Fe-S-cluster containining protein